MLVYVSPLGLLRGVAALEEVMVGKSESGLKRVRRVAGPWPLVVNEDEKSWECSRRAQLT